MCVCVLKLLPKTMLVMEAVVTLDAIKTSKFSGSNELSIAYSVKQATNEVKKPTTIDCN